MLENPWKLLSFLFLIVFQWGNAQDFSQWPSLSGLEEVLDNKQKNVEIPPEAVNITGTAAPESKSFWVKNQANYQSLDNNIDETFESDDEEMNLEILPEAVDSSTTTSSSDAFMWMETEVNQSFNSKIDEKFEKENKYWSVSKARKAIIKQDWDCRSLRHIMKARSYKFENHTYKTTGEKQIEFNWREDVSDFGSCLCLAANDLRLVIIELAKTLKDGNWSVVVDEAKKDPHSEKKIKTYMKRAEDFINLVIKFVEKTIPFNEKTKQYEMMYKWKNTWKNWFQLSITFPCLLAHYMMVPYKLREIPSKKITTNILKIIPTPFKSLSYDRDGANAIGMFGPWLIAQIYHLGCEEKIYKKNIINGEVYGNITKVIALPYSVDRFALGLHRDGTYISHETVLGFGYLKMICSSDTMYAYSFDKNLPNKCTPLRHCRRVLSLLLHHNINRGPPGILSRGNDFSSDSELDAPLGGKIMPLARILRINTPKCRFFVRGVTGGLGFFEADRNSNLYSQYWVQSRIPYSAKSSARIPDFKYAYGLIFSTNHDDYIKLKSRTNTTDIYNSTKNSWSIVGSLGLTEETRQDFLLQNYEIQEYGKYRVYEYIRYSHRDKIYAVVDLEIDNRKGDEELGIRYSLVDVDPHKIEQTKHELQVLKISAGKIARMQHIVNLETCTIRTILEEKHLRDPMWQDFDAGKTVLRLDEFENGVDKWTLNTTNNVVSSSVSGIHSCAAPLPNEKEFESIRDGEFVFDAEDRNAYVYKKK
ncbi:uncharacterized protein LOC135831711 [Planococcus citri]|uniref:uncharacterized protein LOC135831711 n=1 Tax=Planococcus citri TaxID=170843 RepID=UPI0031F933D2